MKEYIITIDMGGTKLLGAITNSNNQILERVKLATDTKNGIDGLVNSIMHIINTLIFQVGIQQENVKAVVIGVPGSVNPFTGLISVAPNIGLINVNLKELLHEKINVPIYIENDVNLGAIGILGKELDENSKNVLVVFIGTGIGGALIFDRKIYRGSNYFAGEIGHMKLPGYDNLCGCGKKGCFEAVASRTAIAKEILANIKKGNKSVITKVLSDNKKIKSKSLKFALNEKDELVTRIIKEKSLIIGKTLGSITNLLNVDAIVLGGGVTEALSKYIIPWIKKGFNLTVLESLADVKIIPTELGDDAAIYAGYYLVKEMEESK
ncbi:MAG TPA: ROK family protein [Ignavibacteriales bacterium]|mgnify:CR=1 FL=1|nr:ROK family protein [Ignavibacteriales bacterium]HOL81855.1 ROK family protein [Ignavibacteriales bacterium]HOM65044.1 ROK family protein [Ignavibacteriales bacterium]HPD67224.1 ROK family protein [Ignavibacteriales bacterium]HPP34008.1 ROK family protein [Ignavibacteriales bacterium]